MNTIKRKIFRFLRIVEDGKCDECHKILPENTPTHAYFENNKLVMILCDKCDEDFKKLKEEHEPI